MNLIQTLANRPIKLLSIVVSINKIEILGLTNKQ